MLSFLLTDAWASDNYYEHLVGTFKLAGDYVQGGTEVVPNRTIKYLIAQAPAALLEGSLSMFVRPDFKIVFIRANGNELDAGAYPGYIAGDETHGVAVFTVYAICLKE